MFNERVFTAADRGEAESYKHAFVANDGIDPAAMMRSVPQNVQTVEENTVPSWLWHHRAVGAAMSDEISFAQIVERIAGAATYAGWKKGLFDNEQAAVIFCDEVRYLLRQRVIGLETSLMARLGCGWAYGMAAAATKAAVQKNIAVDEISIRNQKIDAILSGDAAAGNDWKQSLAQVKSGEQMRIVFSDTTTEWSTGADELAPRAMVDLLHFQRHDGTVNATALMQAVRLTVTLLELLYDETGLSSPARPLAIGYGNMAALLMASAIAYDSEAGRSTAAAISAIITAEATASSAMLAAVCGPCTRYAEKRDQMLKTVRNRRRAAYGERTDYERLSILPHALTIEAGADLALIAAARRCWDTALDAVQNHGLRHLQVTSLFEDAGLAALLDCSAQGIAPEQRLMREYKMAPDQYRRALHPAAAMGLARLGCDPADIKAITTHVVGYQTLVAAPGINHIKLKALGFDKAALERVEARLRFVSHIRFAFTPWVTGVAFCRERLKVTDRQIEDYSFDLLHHLGFTSGDIQKANAFCCGHGTVAGVAELPAGALAIFAGGGAVMEMAAAVQVFVSGDVDFSVTMPGSMRAEKRAEPLLAAWRAGLKSVTLQFDYSEAKNVDAPQLAKKTKILKRQAPSVAKPAPLMPHKPVTAQMKSAEPKPKATLRSMTIKRGKGKSGIAGQKGH